MNPHFFLIYSENKTRTVKKKSTYTKTKHEHHYGDEFPINNSDSGVFCGKSYR